jgi:hypothetical protein
MDGEGGNRGRISESAPSAAAAATVQSNLRGKIASLRSARDLESALHPSITRGQLESVFAPHRQCVCVSQLPG